MIILKKILIFILLIIPFNVFATNSKPTIVMDYDSGRILYSKNSNKKSLIASTTKIMTCIITIENSNIEKEIEVGEEVLEMYGTNIYIEPGEKIKIIDLLYGLMLRSGNDAAETLAKNIFSSEEEFISKMNEKAKEIGMNNTIFNNPHGLDENTKNYSTAHDMALLSRYAYNNKTYKKIIKTKKYIAKTNNKTYEWYNRMSLLNNYKYCRGGKNGYTPKAGKSLVSYASKDNMNLIIVTLEDNDIYDTHKNLYDKYFSTYKKYTIVDKKNFKVDKSLINKDVYIKNSFKYPLQKSELNKIYIIVQISNKSLKNEIGKVIIKLNNKEIGFLKIYSKEKEEENFFQKIKKLFIR